MGTALRPVDPTRPRGRIARAFARLAATRPARVVSRWVNWKLDPMLLRLTGGRFATTLMFRAALLETRGAKTGEPRRNPVIYFNDGHRVIIVASNAGAARHPAWYHNLRADPNVRLGGHPMTASVVKDESERQRLWALACNVFPAFAIYSRDAGERAIPIVRLSADPNR